MINNDFIYNQTKDRYVRKICNYASRDLFLAKLIWGTFGTIIALGWIIGHYYNVLKHGDLTDRIKMLSAPAFIAKMKGITIWILDSPLGILVAPISLAGVPFLLFRVRAYFKIKSMRGELQERFPQSSRGTISKQEYTNFLKNASDWQRRELVRQTKEKKSKELLIQEIGASRLLQALRKGDFSEKIIGNLPWTTFDALKPHLTSELIANLKADPHHLFLFCLFAQDLKLPCKIRLSQLLLESDEAVLFPYQDVQTVLDAEHFEVPADPVTIVLKDLRRYTHAFSFDSLRIDATKTAGLNLSKASTRCHLVFSEFIANEDRETLNAITTLLFERRDYQEVDAPRLLQFTNKFFAPLFHILMHFLTEEERVSCGAPDVRLKEEAHG
jgi:hypothetical protein